MNNEQKFQGCFLLHSLFLNYTVFGGIFASSKVGLWIHSTILPLTLLHWKLNNNKCFITELEQKYVKNTKYENWVTESPLFTQRYLSLFGIHINEIKLEIILKYSIGLTWLYTIFKVSSLYHQQILLEQRKLLQPRFPQFLLELLP